MGLIHIDAETCILCKTCQAVCFRNLIHIYDDRVDPSEADRFCANCGQCQAVCPTGALVHTGLDQDQFLPLDKAGPVTAPVFIDFLRSRRSHRNFKKDQVPFQEVETIARACRLAPAGSNDAAVGLVIVRDPALLAELSRTAIELLTEEAAGTINKYDRPDREKELDADQASALNRARSLARFLESAPPGRDPILYNAPTVIFVHSSPYTNFPKENSMAAAHTAMLTAHALGLGTCYISLMAKAANRDPRIKDRLEIPPENDVHAVIALGRPRFRYRRTTPPRPMTIRIVEG